MNFDDIKKINKNKRVNWFMRHVSKPIINRAGSSLTLAEFSAYIMKCAQVDTDNGIVPKSISNYYRLKYKRNIYSKASISISFSEMDHYI